MEYFKNPSENEVYGYDPADQQDLIDEAIAKGWENVTGSWPPPPSPEDLKAECKAKAMSLLANTDWVNQPDVRNPANLPHLTNAADFDAYRLAVRQYAVYPVIDPVWPTLPVEVWA